MTEKNKKLTSAEMLSRMHTVPQLAYEFSFQEVLDGVGQFLQYAGYQIKSPSLIGSEKPDFYAVREVGDAIYTFVGIVGTDLEGVSGNIDKLKKIQSILGDDTEYVLVSPPISEFHLINFLSEAGGKQYSELDREHIMFWLCYPNEETVWCFIGTARDQRLYEYFKFGKLNTPQFFRTRFGPPASLQEEDG
ncbi:MAG: hypothetical protein HOC20_04360 [Chloroflexi bacterium]|jgi:hypothetical protein|nr:hypothetical protein [Chloroflexota bacterium]